MTVERLIRFRQARRIYLKRGRGAFGIGEWDDYQSMIYDFDEWADELNKPYREIAVCYFRRVLPDWAVALNTNYSERQVRRIRGRIYDALKSRESAS